MPGAVTAVSEVVAEKFCGPLQSREAIPGAVVAIIVTAGCRQVITPPSALSIGAMVSAVTAATVVAEHPFGVVPVMV